MADEQRESSLDWEMILSGQHPDLVRQRRIFRHLPSDPRCKMCLAPQGGLGGPVMRALGFGRYPPNPQLCNSCFRQSEKHPGGAGARDHRPLRRHPRLDRTGGEDVGAREYSAAVNEYIRAASHAIREPNGIVDKLLGDGIMALFIPGFVGERGHAEVGIEAARAILREVALPVGVGVHSGEAWVGFVGGTDQVRDFTALGDAVNVASRLGSEAAGGEILISARTASAAGLDTSSLESRRLELRGRSEPLETWSERLERATA